MNRKILIIDDEEDLGEILKYNLEAEGFSADIAYRAEEALEAGCSQYDLLLLDVMMPGMSGFRLAQLLKTQEETARIPIIFLTAKDTVDDKVEGLDIGADDYIAKPFSVKEVVARVKAVLRRTATAEEDAGPGSCFAGLSMDLDKKTVTVDGESIDVTRTEFDLLQLLLTGRGQVFSRKQLMERIWAGVIVTDRTVDVNITRLRKKIGRYAQNIATRQGFGYYFDEGV